MSKKLIGNRKCIFWPTSINDQRPKLGVHIDDIVIEGLLDTVADVTIITILASRLASSSSRYSTPRNWDPISNKTKHEVG